MLCKYNSNTFVVFNSITFDFVNNTNLQLFIGQRNCDEALNFRLDCIGFFCL